MEARKFALAQPLVTNLHQAVIAALDQRGYPHHRMLEINIDHGTVTVEGVLPTYYLRQVALECIKKVTGVTEVVDRIQVGSESQDADAPDSSAAVFPPATDNGTLETEACSTTSIPGSDSIVCHC